MTPPARPPSTPPRRPGRGLSPPASPATTHTTDDHLDSSYLFVHEDDTSSEIGSSLRDSIIGELSDSSSDPPGREGWEDESASGDHHHSDDVVQVESDVQPDHGELGGSYIDAEATASSLSGSRDTVHRHLVELSDSQVRLIMPDPSSSFTSATLSSETTPSASLGNLLSVSGDPGKPTTLRRDTSSTIRPIDRSWLENSTKLWNVPPELKEKIDAQEESAYSLLSSTEEIASPFIEDEPKEKVHSPKPRKASLQPLLPMTMTKDVAPSIRRLRAARLNGLRELSKKWSVRASVLALASLLSIGLLGSVGQLPGIAITRKNTVVSPGTSMNNAPLPSAEKTSIWEHFAVSPVLSTTSTSSQVTAPSSTGKIPDLQLIKQALSTLSTTFNVAVPADPETTPSSSKSHAKRDDDRRIKGKSRRRRPSYNVSCCAVSVRDTNTGLAVRPTQYSLITTDTSWKSSIARKLRRAPANNSAPNMTIATPCSCELSEHLGMAFTTSLLRGISYTRHQSSILLQYLGTVYAPAMLELQREWQELLALMKTLSETSSTLTQFIIRRAARGISISRRALDNASRTLRATMPEIHKPHVDPETVAKAKAKAKILSEYVESQAVSLAEYLDEQTAVIQEKSVESLKQAKKGLDRLVDEARRVINEDLAEMSPSSMKEKLDSKRERPPRSRSPKSRGHLSSKSRGAKDRRKASRIPPPEKPSKGRRLLDMLHHGAMALVL